MISINATLLAQIANFLILMFILNRIMFRPILNHLREREEGIRKTRQEAMDLTKQGEDKLVEYHQRIEQAKYKANRRREELRKQAFKEAEAMVAQSKEEEMKIIRGIREEIAEEVRMVRKQFGDQAEALSSYLLHKVLGRELQ